MNDQRSPTQLTTQGRGSHYFALAAGTRLHEFEILSVLGYGGFGITYLAMDTLLEERVALKEFFPNDLAVRVSDATVRAKSTGEQQDFQTGLKTFLEEARLMARFRHPNIVHVRRFFELHGTGYIVQDYEQGQTLGERLSQGPIEEVDLRRLLAGVLDGLEAVHERAILHRDLKPDNIILRPNGTPVLIDFGAARDFASRHSRSVTAIATGSYTPPEQWGAGGQQGPWSDLYALGATLYRCVTGSSPPISLQRLRTDPLVPATTAAQSKYDPALLRTIDWMLAVDETQRPTSVQAVREGLLGTPTTSQTDTRDPIAEQSAARSSSSGKKWIAAASTVVTLALGLTGYAYYSATARNQATDEEAAYTNARGDLEKLQAYKYTCKICTHRDDASKAVEALQRHRAVDLENQQDLQNYQQARGNAGLLKGYLQSCKVCDYKSAALQEIAQLNEAEIRASQIGQAQQVAEYQRLTQLLDTAKYDRGAIGTFLMTCGVTCPGDLRNEAQRRSDLIAAEETRYRAAQNDIVKLRSYSSNCEACNFKVEAETRARQLDERNGFGIPDTREAVSPLSPPRPQIPGESCASLRSSSGTGADLYCASSVLSPEFGNTYWVQNLFSSNNSTAWVHGTHKVGTGQWIVVQFDGLRLVKSVTIRNGYQKNADVYSKNSRVQRLRLIFSQGESKIVTLEDHLGEQTITVNPAIKAYWVQFLIEAVYPGWKYPDTAISKLRVSSEPAS